MTCCQTGGYYAGPLHQTGGFYGGARFQRGGAMRGFAGPEYQMGGKWAFGQFLWRHAKPLLSFLGKRALKTGVGVGQDVLEGRNLKESAKERLSEVGQEVAQVALDKVKKKLQIGKGRRRIKRKKSSCGPTVCRRKSLATARRRKASVSHRRRRRRVHRQVDRRIRRRSQRRRKRKTSLKTIFD